MPRTQNRDLQIRTARRNNPAAAVLISRINGQPADMSLLLLILGIVLLVAGVGALLRKQMLWGIVLIVVGVLVAPSGSIFGL